MEDFEDNELDNIFKKAIEGKELPPPPPVWKHIQASARQQRLIQQRKRWKVTAITLLILWGLTTGGVWWYKQEDFTKGVTKPIGQVEPQKGNQSASQTGSSDAPKGSRHTESLAGSIQSASTSPAHKAEEKPADQPDQQEKSVRLSTAKEIRSAHPQHVPNSQLQTPVHQELVPKDASGNTNTYSHTATKAMTARPEKKNLSKMTDNSGILSGMSAEKRLSVELRSKAMGLLSPRSVPPVTDAVLPLPQIAGIETENTVQPAGHLRKTDWKDRLSVAVYYVPARTKLQVKESSVTGHASNQAVGCQLIGARLGYELSSRLAIQVGLARQTFRLRGAMDAKADMQTFQSEKMNEQYYVFYPTVLGTAQLPVDDMGSQPMQVGVKEMSLMQVSYWQIPWQMQYTFWQKRRSQYTSFTIYGFAGGYIWLGGKQNISLHLYDSGQQPHAMEVTHLYHTRKAWGLQAGLGGTFSLSPHIRIWAEPTFGRDMCSLTKQLSYRSFTQSIGVKTGLTWAF